MACSYCHQQPPACTCGTTPAQPTPTRFRIRYGIVYCELCGLAVPYCPGHLSDDAPESDGVTRELVKQRGGR